MARSLAQNNGRTGGQRARDRNRDIRISAVRALEGLLATASRETFRGTVQVEVFAKEGRLGGVKTHVTQFHD